MTPVLFILLLSVGVQDVAGIYGGCMSYSTAIDSSGHLKVKIFFLNGWQIGKGPCYRCIASDKGKSVTKRRNQFINDRSNTYLFGKWQTETGAKTDSVTFSDITDEVNNVTKDIVLMVSEKERWELEGSEILLEFPTTKERFDITFKSIIDETMTLIPNLTNIDLQVKINPGIRSDTNRTNRSPVVLVKPLYSLELQKQYNIHLTSVDNDGDAVHCEKAEWIEAGSIGPFMKDIIKRGLFSLDPMKCVMRINVSSGYFHIGDTFGAAVTVKDYNTHPIWIQTDTRRPHTPYQIVIGRVVVMMYFKITGKTYPPEFIPPTPANNQVYTIYVGGDFSVKVYAKASPGRKIIRFDFLRRDGKPVNHTGIQDASNVDANTALISTSWSPTVEDIGYHILCANAEDDQGMMTVDLHCFQIIVKANIIRLKPEIIGKPYFVSFPEPTDLKCTINTFCRFPVYAKTSDSKGITSIVSTQESKENVTIQYSRERINGIIDATVAQVEFFAGQAGVRQICLKASDSTTATESCLFVTVQLPDPCASKPCQYSGRCLPFIDNTGFACSCQRPYTGKLCQNKINECDRKPCHSAGSCQPIPSAPFFICVCQNGRSGSICEFVIDRCKSNPCKDTEICKSSGSNMCIQKQQPITCLVSKMCQLTTTSSCVKDSSGNPACVCALGKENDGICTKDISLYSSKTISPQFVPPTPGLGSVIECDTSQAECPFSVFVLSSDKATISISDGSRIGSLNPVVSNCTKERGTSICRVLIKLIKTFNTIEDTRTKEYDLCINVASQTNPQKITDQTCVRVIIKPKVWSMGTNGTSCSFSRETLGAGSTIGCQKGIPCHFFVYTVPYQNGTCAEINIDNEHIGVFKPIQLSNPDLCSYDVVYTNTTGIGTNKVCLMPCVQGQSRCFIMNVHHIEDRCSSNPCLNDGACQTTPSGDLNCNCKSNFWGDYCEKGLCDSHSYCQNEAICYRNHNHIDCLCQLGNSGPSCASDANENFTSSVDNGGHFTQMALLETMTCFLDIPCDIPFSVTKNVHYMPTVILGLVDRTLSVAELGVDTTPLQGGMVRGKMVVIGSELGLKTLCLDSVATSRDGKIEDEICFKINVITGNNLTPDQFKPHFVSPTLPDQTVFQCQEPDQCHLSLWATNKLLEDNCPVLKSDKAVENGVFIFPQASSARVPCVFDVVIAVSNITNLNVCFSLVDSFAKIMDERCYTIRIISKITVRGACAGVSCFHDGFCDGQSSPAKCKCRSGFSGENCSTDEGNVQGDNSNSTGYALFGDVMLPKMINCPLAKDCVIPFTVAKSDKFNITWNGTNIDTKSLTYYKKSESRDFAGQAVIMHSTQGRDSFCLSLTSIKGDLYDNVCCFIMTVSVSTPDSTVDNYQPQFINPSPTNGSEFTCTPGKPCHMILSIRKGHNLKCPEIKDRSDNETSVHMFSSTSDTECHKDVWIGSSHKDNGKTKEYCFQTSVSGYNVLGEMRCFKVHFEPHVLPPPPATTTTTTSTTTTTTTTLPTTKSTAIPTTTTTPLSTTKSTAIPTTTTTSPRTKSTPVPTTTTTTPMQKTTAKSTTQTTSPTTKATTATSATTKTDPTTRTPSAPSISSSSGMLAKTYNTVTTKAKTSDTSTIILNSSVKGTTTTKTFNPSTITAKQSGTDITTAGTLSTGTITEKTSGTGVTTAKTSVTGTTTAKTLTTDPTAKSSSTSMKTAKASGSGTPEVKTSGAGITTAKPSDKGIATAKTSSTGTTTAKISGTDTIAAKTSSTGTTTAKTSGTRTTTAKTSGTSATIAKSQNKGPVTTSHCNAIKAKERGKNGRVECFCPDPTSGRMTKVITFNPRVSTEKLLLAAGLGSGAMISTLGLAALLYVVTKKCSRPEKMVPNQRRVSQAKRKISTTSITRKRQ